MGRIEVDSAARAWLVPSVDRVGTSQAGEHSTVCRSTINLSRWMRHAARIGHHPTVAVPVDDAGVERVVAAIAADLIATLGWSPSEADAFVRYEGTVDHFSQVLAEFDLLSVARSVLGNVQEAMHGQGDGLDNLWPRCPKHGTHPLFCDCDLVWRCPATDEDDPSGFLGGVPFGWLDAIWPDAQ
jgi:hypothetical protein